MEVFREVVFEKKDIFIVGMSRSGKIKFVEVFFYYVFDEWKIVVIMVYGEFKFFRFNIEVVDMEFDRCFMDVRIFEVIEKIRCINLDYVVIDMVYMVDVVMIFKILIDDYVFIVMLFVLIDDIKGEVMYWFRIDEDIFNRFDVVVELVRDWRIGFRKINRIYKVKDGELI